MGFRFHSKARYPVPSPELTVTVRTNPFWRALERGGWERECFNHLARVVREGNAILDVGAWIGPYTLFFSGLVGPRGVVHAFEPDPAARVILQDNLRRNKMANVHVVALCLSNAPGEVMLRTRAWGDSRSTLLPHLDEGDVAALAVRSTTIDAFCEGNGLRPDGIKIDVEGAEALVREGARRTIDRCHPWVLLEFHALLMSRDERRANWRTVTEPAREVTFIDGDGRLYAVGDDVDSMPDGSLFHVFIRY